MPRDDLYLVELVEACRHITSFLAGVTVADWEKSDLIRSAVLHQLIVIGEAATGISTDVRERHPELPWADIRAFRNVAVHEYFGLEWPTVWVIATQRVPGLERDVLRVVQKEFPGLAARLGEE